VTNPLKTPIAFTGGGSAGHVTPNLALIDLLLSKQRACFYIGTADGIEKRLLEPVPIPYYSISAGKLRRYFSWKTLAEPFKIFVGFLQSLNILRRERPACVFSKGGFVSVPVIYAARLLKIPVIIHESDITPGLANRLCFPLARDICVSFSQTKDYIRYKDRIINTGAPIRPFLLKGDPRKAREICGFTDNKPVLLVMGGGLGAQAINKVVRERLIALLERYNVLHLCGTGKLDPRYSQIPGYYQVAYANEEMADFYALADLVISRAGSNTLFELIFLKKPHILVPLSLNASRGEQITNANYTASENLSYVIPEAEFASRLIDGLKRLDQSRSLYQSRLTKAAYRDGRQQLVGLLESYVEKASPEG
jgi:UDP-N-acetylglucosamine--N-acetylmuramyl-(pentapeptide) pyrophosphoryl-undecaprenol N-acetylglucosamine transferase